jgi:hypothetical protein
MTSIGPTEPAFAIAAPEDLAVHFTDSAATITWHDVPGSQGYAVTIRPLGVQGPYPEEQMLGDSYTVAFSDFPGYGSHKNGYAYEVCSISKRGGRACTSVSGMFSVRSLGHGVSTSNLHRAARKASSCLAKGEKAGVVTAAGLGIVAAVSSWIPGVDAITAGSVGIASAGRGAASFVACLIDW